MQLLHFKATSACVSLPPRLPGHFWLMFDDTVGRFIKKKVEYQLKEVDT